MAWIDKLSYHRRLFAALLIYSLAMVAAVAAFQYQRERRHKAETLDARLQGVNARLLQELARGASPEALRAPLGDALPGLRLTVMDRRGRVVYDNSPLGDTLQGTPHTDRREIAAAISRGHGYSLRRHSASTGQTYFYSATADSARIVRTAVPYSLTLRQLLSADYGYIWALLAIAAVMCTLGYMATRRLGEHVSRLNRFAQRAERGERIYDTDPFPHDELGEISSHIVRLYARLQQATADRDREHRAALREQQEKDRIKRQLTNNINHELKTPVASMQLCLETLLAHPAMPAPQREEILSRSARACRRLGRLLADVSTITRLDDGSSCIAAEEISIAAIAADATEEYTPQAEARGMTIINRVTFSDPVRGNRSLMESVFANLLANAIAYSGGTIAEIGQKTDDGTLTITVSDDGCGVDPQHLPRLFERFYRVDKGRSRQAGGTGLGLAIVKNAIAWHGGTIEASLRPGGGMQFTIRLPIPR